MIRRNCFTIFILLFVANTAFAFNDFSTDATHPADKPNVLVFFIDDLGYMDLGCNGSQFYETPQIDALAKRSVRFKNFYSAHPVCSPTRAALMTGKAPQRMGITQWIPQPNEKHLPHDEFTLAEAFKEAGYATGYMGKWHLGNKDADFPTEHGFDWKLGVNRGGAPGSYFHPFKRNKGKKAKKEGIDYWAVPDLEDAQEGDYVTDVLTDHAIEFIKEKSAGDKPFFLCFGHYAVHTPIQAPKELVEKYEKKKKQKWGDQKIEGRNESGKGTSRMRQDNPTYAAMVENLDTNVGRVLAALDDLKITDNTIVLFTSDNGGLSTLKNKRNNAPTSCSPFRAGKGWTYEGGIRIPTMVSWPGKIKPGASETRGITMDIYPTLLELTGQKQRTDQHLDGVSLVSAINGTPDQSLDDRFLAWHYPHDHGSGHTPSNAIRLKNWKLVHHIDSGEYELYDLENDLGEMTNLAGKHPEKKSEMAGMLNDWIKWTTKK